MLSFVVHMAVIGALWGAVIAADSYIESASLVRFITITSATVVGQCLAFWVASRS
jgi:uncharacterized membrane protein YjfL (UPF0719 family)